MIKRTEFSLNLKEYGVILRGSTWGRLENNGKKPILAWPG